MINLITSLLICKRLFKLLISIILLGSMQRMGYSQDYLPFQDKMTGKFGYMDSTGHIVIKPKYCKVGEFYEGLARVEESPSQPIYINTFGKAIYNPPINNISFLSKFSNGYGYIAIKDGEFYINKTGKIVSKKYQFVNSFSEGIAMVCDADKLYVINNKLEVLFKMNIDLSNLGPSSGEFHDGLMPIKNIKNEWGYLDKNNIIVIKPMFRYALPFNNGYAKVETRDFKYAIINQKGEIVYNLDMGDFPMQQCIIKNGFLYWNDTKGQVRIVNLSDHSTSFVKTPNLSGNHDAESRPILIGNYIFSDGTAFDFNGKIIWHLDEFYSVGAVYYGKYIEIKKTPHDYDDYIFYSPNGNPILAHE